MTSRVTRRSDRRGTTAAEFAIAISVVLLLTFAVIDLGRLYFYQHALDYGVEKASRYAVVNSASATATTVKSQFVAALTPAVGAGNASAASVSVSFSPTTAQVGGTVTVSATLAWSAVSALDFLPGLTLSSSHTLIILH